jgi:uncharacterized repeat protein (TIGR03803 family)
MKTIISAKSTIWIIVTLFIVIHSTNAQESNLFEFTTETGKHYDSRLVSDGTYLFGCKYDGDTLGNGSVFRMKADGTDYSVIHTFANGLQGANPVGSLVLSGSTLFGITVFGGSDNVGTIFKMETNGTGFQKLLDFIGENGALPYSTLIVSGNDLYGVSQQGGQSGVGLVFKLKTDGTGHTTLLQFDGTNGASPVGSLALSDGVLYGLTYYGGVNNSGVIYSLNTDGTGYRLLKELETTTGANPYGGFIVKDNFLYATATNGGRDGFGTLFQIAKDGTNFKVLRDFGSGGGGSPFGTLNINNSVIFGYAGNFIFGINTDGNNFSLLKDFSIYNDDGRDPSGQLLVKDNKLFGHIRGGKNNYGVVFTMNFDGSSYEKIIDFTSTNKGYEPSGSQEFLASKLYGVTRAGGDQNAGTVYSIDTLGTNFTIRHNFDGKNGAYPESSLNLEGNSFYGVTTMGGPDFSGVLFSLDTTDFIYKVHVNFDGPSNGSFPSGSLIEVNGLLYGMTSYGGADNKGTIFEYNLNTQSLKTIFAFQETDAQIPRGSLINYDNKLYGLCLGGVGDGVVFSINIDGTGFTKILDVNSLEGGRYGNSLALFGDSLIVTTKQGGVNDLGVLLKMHCSGTGFKKLHDFDFNTGSIPEGELFVIKNEIYGMASSGGIGNSGTAYKIQTDGNGFSTIFEFSEDENSSNGRTTESGYPTTVKGSLSFNYGSLFGAVTLKTGEITNGRILKYALTKDDDDIDKVLGISDDDLIRTTRLYPNPATEMIFLPKIEDQNCELKVVDVFGRAIILPKMVDNAVNISLLPNGFYTLIVGMERMNFIKH